MDAGDIWQKRKSFVNHPESCASSAGDGTILVRERDEQRSGSGDPLPQVEDEEVATSRPLLSDTEDVSLEQCGVDVQSEKEPQFATQDKLASKLSPLKLAGSKTSILSEGGGAHLSFHNITYTVNVRGKCCGKSEAKSILNSISGICRPGMNAILGPTGGGKSSLLDILAGRKDKIGLSGHVLVDGAIQPDNFKCMSGYVIQDDILMGMLTVRENIQFSAALRLPSTMSKEKRNARVEEIISELGLNKCAATRVGTEFTRGISGGERKRTNIAMELITSPSVLFLDEPTTGLDSNTANSVMHLLQRLSRRGKTIVFSIHQPRYSIFKLFDSLMLLSDGECVYHGPSSDALEHFENIGYVCEEHNNPSDFFLDILSGCLNPVCSTESDQYASEICPSTEKNIDGKLTVVFIPEAEDGSPDLSMRQQSLVQQYQKSSWHHSLQTELTQIANDYEQIRKQDNLKRHRLFYATSFLTQLMIVSCRTFRNMIRNPHGFVTQLFSAVILGLIVGTIYYQIDSSSQSGIQNRVGAFFFIVMNYVFGNMAAVDIFIKERSLFIHENVSGFYRVSVYFLAKLLFDVFPMRALPILLFASVTYWMIGLRALFWWSFPFYLLNTILTSLAGTSVALIFSASSRVHAIGTILTALVWTFMMVFSGLLVNVDTIPVWLQQLKYFSIFRYSMNAFLVNELKGAQFCDDVSDMGHRNSTQCSYGDSYLAEQGIPFETTWDMWSNQVALLCLAFAFLIITYIQLRRIKKLQ